MANIAESANSKARRLKRFRFFALRARPWFSFASRQYVVPGYVLETLLKGRVAKAVSTMDAEEKAAILRGEVSGDSKALDPLLDGWKPNTDAA